MTRTNKKIAVVCSGWHFCFGFYSRFQTQKIPKGWSLELFCVSHRDPEYAIKEKANDVFDDSYRGKLDKILYKKVLNREEIEAYGWKYKEYPNTIGDWGNSNQWLEENDYNDYSLLLFTHDDNLIIQDSLFFDIIKDGNFKKWDILTNSPGMPMNWIRGSFEFFKPSVIKRLGGAFDLSEVSLTREGKFNASNETTELLDWNNTVNPLMRFIEKEKLSIGYLSPAYRVSAYVLEGERGYISKTHGANTVYEEKGLKYLRDNKII